MTGLVILIYIAVSLVIAASILVILLCMDEIKNIWRHRK